MNIEKIKNLYLLESNGAYGHTLEKTEAGYAIKSVVPSGPIMYVNDLGVQTSRYHQEDLWTHVLHVTREMYEPNHDIIAFVIGLLHDVGKKYTLGLSPTGDVCFYGHEEISANIVNDLLNEWVKPVLTEEEKNTIVTVIRAHLQLKLLKGIALECFNEGFKSIYGEHAFSYLVLLDKADHGITTSSSEDDANTYINTANEFEEVIQSIIEPW